MSETSPRSDIAHDLAIRNFRLMENWHDAEASAILAPTMHSAESVAAPPGARQPGVVGARATYDWLHSAYADLRWTVHTVVAEGDWVVAHATMSGGQTGPFVTYTPDGEAGQVFAATGGASPRPRRTGSASPADRSSNTAPIVTTWVKRCSWAGSGLHPAPVSRTASPSFAVLSAG